jgi:hypothetical protein
MYARDIIRGRIFLGSSIVVLEFVMVGAVLLYMLISYSAGNKSEFDLSTLSVQSPLNESLFMKPLLL